MVGTHYHDVVIEVALPIRVVLNCSLPVADNLHMVQLEWRGLVGLPGLSGAIQSWEGTLV